MNATTEPIARQSTRRRLGGLGATLGQLLTLICVIAAFCIADAWQNPAHGFSSFQNLRTTAVQTSTVAVAALGMTLIIIAGGIDLSAGAALALSSTVLAWCLRAGYPVGTSLLACLGTGCAAGMLNGSLISRLRLVPFIVTLGTMSIFQGFAKMVAKQTTIRPAAEQIPAWLPSLVTTRPQPEWLLDASIGAVRLQIPNFPLGVWLALALAAVLACVLRFTVFGRYVFALGSNEATARLCGINVTLVKIAVYTLAGFFVSVAGMYQFARLSSGDPTSGNGMELRIIAAVVIGGGSLSGGQGSVLGTLAGAAIMAVIASGCQALGFQDATQNVVVGVVIIAAATVDQLRQRRLTAA